MRRCYKDCASLPAPFDARGHIQSFRVHWNRHQYATRQSQYMPRQPVARFFHPGGILHVEQDARGDFQRLLGTRNDHDLFRIAAYRASRSKIRTNYFAQGSKSHRAAVVKLARMRISAMTHDEHRPDLERELVVSRLADAKSPESSQPRNSFVRR